MLVKRGDCVVWPFESFTPFRLLEIYQQKPRMPPGCCLLSGERRFRSMAIRILQNLSTSQVIPTNTILVIRGVHCISQHHRFHSALPSFPPVLAPSHPSLLSIYLNMISERLWRGCGTQRTPGSVSDVYVTSLTEYPTKEIAELMLHSYQSLYHNNPQ